jgi:hypothetical protein
MLLELDHRVVKHTVAVTDLAVALMLAEDFDRANVCCGLAIIASMLAGKDPDARTMLAQTMLKLARELDPELVNARWRQ